MDESAILAAGRDRPGGALVVSLDFELHWGVRDVCSTSSGYVRNLLGAREAILRMLDIFAEFSVRATWATVGFLFAESREELAAFCPGIRPCYRQSSLNPYTEHVGMGEQDDPLHYAPSLIRRIQETPGQEIGTHTYSHFYCLECGADPDSFREDLRSAMAIARARGVEIRSIVLPRNQWTSWVETVLAESGIICYRGNQPGWMYQAEMLAAERFRKRAARFGDAHLPLTRWAGTPARRHGGVAAVRNVPATCFLRPVSAGTRWLNEMHISRIVAGLTQAAIHGKTFHLWWHPHNFGSRTVENLASLRVVLDHYRTMSREYGMRSMTMVEAATHDRVEAARDNVATAG